MYDHIFTKDAHTAPMALNVRLHNTAELRSEDDILLFRELTEHVLWLRRRRRVAFLKYLLCLSAERRLPRSVACLTCERKDNLCKSNGTQRRRLRRKPSSPHVHSSKSGMLLVPALVQTLFPATQFRRVLSSQYHLPVYISFRKRTSSATIHRC